MTVDEMKYFFEPHSIALVGASRTPGKTGYTVAQNLKKADISGGSYLVNPNADEILGLKSYPDIDSLPEKPELVVITTPSRHVLPIVESCARNGVRAIVIVSSGFAEEGYGDLQDEIVAKAKAAGMRIVGPNTTGIMNTENNVTSTFVSFEDVRRGNVAFVVQTGVFAGAMLETVLTTQHFGISKVFGLGNKCDVDDADALEYLAQDDETEVIAMYIEGLKDGRRFFEMAKEVSKHKSIVVLKSGRSELGARVALSHTASLTGRDEIFDAACRQAGIIRVRGFEELIDVTKLLALAPRAGGKRIAIASVTGAGCVMGSDYCTDEGLEVATLTDESLGGLEAVSPEWHKPAHPIDLWPIMDSTGFHGFKESVGIMMNDPNVDAGVVITGAVRTFPLVDENKLREQLGAALRNDKPLILVMFGDRESIMKIAANVEPHGIPVYPSIERAIRVLGLVCNAHVMRI